ncbi:MAG TPA: cupredoxin domain-containing protein [Candidatus Paceibacterota bacterium]
MNKLITFIGLVVLVIIGIMVFGGSTPKEPESANVADTLNPVQSESPAPQIKEFSLTAFYETKNGKPSAGFSIPEITVNKGDIVRIKITNTAGTHDFNINEYGITSETPLNQETVVEFTADKAGEFKYYCSKFNHRQIGQEGTLRVIE